jgi:predicted dehydrogenase
MNEIKKNQSFDRRGFLKIAGIGTGAGILGLQNIACSDRKQTTNQPAIQGFDDKGPETTSSKVWIPVSDRKIRVGLVGYGVCKFSAAFGFQNHPNVEIAAVSDLFPDRCAELAKRVNCNKTYPSLEEMVKDDTIEAIFCATDPPGHARHAILAMEHGKHIGVTVPAVWGSLEDAEKLIETVKRTGLKYMMFETSMFHENLHAMRQIYTSGGFGKVVYAEGEYWHYDQKGIQSFKNWRLCAPPLWYPTHATAYYVGVTNKSFTDVSCMGMPSEFQRYKEPNQYNNAFSTEVALLQTSEGGMARMSKSMDTKGGGYGGETGRIRGTRGSYYEKYEGFEENLPDLTRPPLPPSVPAGGHGGSHGLLMDEFVTAILEDRKPLVDVAMALNMTVGGVVAHQSALRGGELMKIPQFSF